MTIRGVAGEPLKVVLLAPEIPTAVSAAAVALERAAYLLITAVIIVVSALVAATTLALSGVWIRVFGVTAGVSIVIIIALLRLAARPERQPQPSSHNTGTERPSFFARFAHEFVQQLRNLLRRDRRRLAVLVAFESAAFALMALEVWVALWAAGTPVTAVGALAAETFTRVASFASAFIPANLGALEASNVAAANAVGAAGGAAALALVRRLRGLFWCVVGFAIYPRRERASDKAPRLLNKDVHSRPLVIVEEAGSDVSVLDHVGGLPIGERLARAAARAGYERLLVWAPRQRREWRQLATRLPDGIRMTVIDDPADWQEALGELQAESPQVVTSDFVPLRADETGSLQGIRVGSRQDFPRAERELRQSVFKPTDGRLGRFNRRMSIPVSIALIRWVRLSPHVMSGLIIGLGLYSGWLFSDGAYLTGVLAALVSLAASILDGSDGELARFQVQGICFRLLARYGRRLHILSGDLRRPDGRHGPTDGMVGLPVGGRLSARRQRSDLRPADSPAPTHYERSAGRVPHDREVPLLRHAEAMGIYRCEAVELRDARDDAVRDSGVGAFEPASCRAHPGGARRPDLLDQSRGAAAEAPSRPSNRGARLNASSRGFSA